MKKLFWTMAMAAVAVPGMAQAVILYAPTMAVKDQGISLKAWGAGIISETDEIAYEGTRSLRVSTRNLFAGGIMTLGKPVDMNVAAADKNNLLRIAFRPADAAAMSGGGTGREGDGGGAVGGGLGAAGGGGSVGGAIGGSGGGGGQRGGGGGGGQRGGGGGVPGGGAPVGGGQTSAPASQLSRMRMIITTTDGKKSEAYLPANVAGGQNGWRSVAIPLQAINGFDKTNRQVKEIAFAGDTVTTFYIGDVRVINDSTPITGDLNVGDMNLALNDTVTLIGNGYGGSSLLKYSWDFDDRDGIQEDAVGQGIKRQFRKPGTYTITLTISDKYGLKQPHQVKVKAVVNP